MPSRILTPTKAPTEDKTKVKEYQSRKLRKLNHKLTGYKSNAAIAVASGVVLATAFGIGSVATFGGLPAAMTAIAVGSCAAIGAVYIAKKVKTVNIKKFITRSRYGILLGLAATLALGVVVGTGILASPIATIVVGGIVVANSTYFSQLVSRRNGLDRENTLGSFLTNSEFLLLYPEIKEEIIRQHTEVKGAGFVFDEKRFDYKPDISKGITKKIANRLGQIANIFAGNSLFQDAVQTTKVGGFVSSVVNRIPSKVVSGIETGASGLGSLIAMSYETNSRVSAKSNDSRSIRSYVYLCENLNRDRFDIVTNIIKEIGLRSTESYIWVRTGEDFRKRLHGKVSIEDKIEIALFRALFESRFSNDDLKNSDAGYILPKLQNIVKNIKDDQLGKNSRERISNIDKWQQNSKTSNTPSTTQSERDPKDFKYTSELGLSVQAALPIIFRMAVDSVEEGVLQAKDVELRQQLLVLQREQGASFDQAEAETKLAKTGKVNSAEYRADIESICGELAQGDSSAGAADLFKLDIESTNDNKAFGFYLRKAATEIYNKHLFLGRESAKTLTTKLLRRNIAPYLEYDEPKSSDPSDLRSAIPSRSRILEARQNEIHQIVQNKSKKSAEDIEREAKKNEKRLQKISSFNPFFLTAISKKVEEAAIEDVKNAVKLGIHKVQNIIFDKTEFDKLIRSVGSISSSSLNTAVKKSVEKCLDEQKKELKPKHPYGGVGLKLDVKDQGLEILEVLSPDFDRFNFSATGSQVYNNQKLVGKFITEIFYEGSFVEIKTLLARPDGKEVIKEIFSDLTQEVKFKLDDGTEVECEKDKKKIYITKDCEKVKFSEGVYGVLYDPIKLGADVFDGLEQKLRDSDVVIQNELEVDPRTSSQPAVTLESNSGAASLMVPTTAPQFPVASSVGNQAPIQENQTPKEKGTFSLRNYFSRRRDGGEREPLLR